MDAATPTKVFLNAPKGNSWERALPQRFALTAWPASAVTKRVDGADKSDIYRDHFDTKPISVLLRNFGPFCKHAEQYQTPYSFYVKMGRGPYPYLVYHLRFMFVERMNEADAADVIDPPEKVQIVKDFCTSSSQSLFIRHDGGYYRLDKLGVTKEGGV